MGSRHDFPESPLAAAGIVGQWEIDGQTGELTLDRVGAEFILGDERLAGERLSLDQVYSLVHDDDREEALAYCRHVMQAGGPCMQEFRAILPRNGLRHLQGRGAFFWDEHGRMIGRGVVIDTTSHREAAEGVPQVTPKRYGEIATHHDALAEAAARGVEVRTALGKSGHGALRLAADLLLWEINTALAERHLISDKAVPGLSKPFR